MNLSPAGAYNIFMAERTLALLAPKKEDADAAFGGFSKYLDAFTRVCIFSEFDPGIAGAEYVNVPTSVISHETASRNFVNAFFRGAGYGGFLYVSSGETAFNADPGAFMRSIESVMERLDYRVWFSTVTDRCNYVYNRYNPTMEIALDIPDLAMDGLPDRIAFTSHSNTGLIIYDFSAGAPKTMDFDERFEIPMYFIIEFLARRRNTKNPDQLYFMNQYLTVPEERGLFSVRQFEWKKFSHEDFKREDALFKSMNVNYKSDNDADLIVKNLHELLRRAKGNI